MVFDAGPYILLFIKEKGLDVARRMIVMHEERHLEIFIHPNNLVEAYKVVSEIRRRSPELLLKEIGPEVVSAQPTPR